MISSRILDEAMAGDPVEQGEISVAIVGLPERKRRAVDLFRRLLDSQGLTIQGSCLRDRRIDSCR